MTKIPTWRPEWTLDIDVLDDDHRLLVDHLTDIARRFGPSAPELPEPPGAPDSDLVSALERMAEEAREHFRREEEFMRTIDYSRIAVHHKEHAVLMAELTEILRHLRDREAKRLNHDEIDSLKHWLIAHVLGSDRGFADHYFQLFRAEAES